MKRNLVLIGYRGTGKSTVAAVLSERTGWPAVSLDQQIVARSGMSIPEIVDRFGWPRFRELEREAVICSTALAHHILDCGGGVIEDPRNVADLRQNSFCVLLTAEIDTIAARIGGDSTRPSLTGKSIVAEIAEKLTQRGPLYEAAAHLIISTDQITPQEITEQIIQAAPTGLFDGAVGD
jgi:shikimate kinase